MIVSWTLLWQRRRERHSFGVHRTRFLPNNFAKDFPSDQAYDHFNLVTPQLCGVVHPLSRGAGELQVDRHDMDLVRWDRWARLL